MRRLLLLILCISAMTLAVSAILHYPADAASVAALHGLPAPAAENAAEAVTPAPTAGSVTDFDRFITGDSARAWHAALPEMPGPTTKLRVRLPGRLTDIFNDSNYIQLRSAMALGISPLDDTRSHFNPANRLVKVTSCADFHVDELTHSHPYLVPRAAAVLHEIGRRFNDSLAARGGGCYRLRVTSLLRTPETVARLRRSNGNAVDSSTHVYATTFDISYTRFACYRKTLPYRSAEDLKNLLGEVLKEMRAEGKLWVKFESRQPCFHITARKEGEAAGDEQ